MRCRFKHTAGRLPDVVQDLDVHGERHILVVEGTMERRYFTAALYVKNADGTPDEVVYREDP